MVDYWDSPEWQGKSVKNKVIRAKQTMGHTSGSKSYARARKDYRSCVEDFMILFHSFVSPTQGKIILGLMSHRKRKGFPWIIPFNLELRMERKTQKNSPHKFMWSR